MLKKSTMEAIEFTVGALLLACGPVMQPSISGTTDSATMGIAPSSTTDTAEPTTTATAATSLDTGTSSATSTTGQEFIMTPDGGATGEHCEPWSQSCPPGQKCVVISETGSSGFNASKCVDITGDGAPGDPCTMVGDAFSGIDDCGFGAMCWNLDEHNHGTCTPLCTGTPREPLCPQSHFCIDIPSDPTFGLCLPGCDPLVQDCLEPEICKNYYLEAFLCIQGDGGHTNDPCDFGDCAKGLACLDTASASSACDKQHRGCCQPFCEFPDAPCPNPDQQCVQWFDPRMPIPDGYENVGVCGIPN